MDKYSQLFYDHDIRYCEYPLPHACNFSWLTPAHRHKRIEYKNKKHMLLDINQVALLCINAHTTIEHNRKLTAEIFQHLRGDDKL